MVEEVTPLQEEGKKSIVPDGAQKKWFWMMAGIIACGALIRIAAAVGNGRFWFDEIITWEIAARPWSEMGKYLAMENHPPLHYLIIAVWMRVFGAGELVVKMSSVLAGALGIWVTGLFGKRLFGARAGLWAAGITALSTYHIFFSAEARMYPWLYLFGTLSLWMWWEMTRPHTNPNSPDYNNMIQSAAAAVPLSGESSHTVVGIGVGVKRGETKYRWLWFLSTVAALYTHLGAVFLLAIEGVWYLWVWWREKKRGTGAPALPLRSGLILLGASLLAWLPWIMVFLKEKAQTLNRNAWYFWVELQEPLPIEAVRRFFFLESFTEFMDLFAWIFVIGALLLAWGMLRKKEGGKLAWEWEATRARGYCLLVLLLPLFMGFLAHVSVIKIYTVASAGAYLLAGAGLAKIILPRPIPPWIFPAAVTGLFLAHMSGVIVGVKPSWRDVGQYLSAHEGEADAVVILSHAYQVALEHYYTGQTPVLPFYPLPDDTGGDTLLRAVRRNWYTILTDKNIDELKTLVAGKQKIFLVVVGRFYKVERIGLEWFMARGWKLKSVAQWEDFMVNPEVYLFERSMISG